MPTDRYWIGYLAMTTALASTSTNPQPLLKATLRDFLEDQPHTDLAADLRRVLKEGKR